MSVGSFKLIVSNLAFYRFFAVKVLALYFVLEVLLEHVYLSLRRYCALILYFVALSDAKVNSTFAGNALEHVYLLLLRRYRALILYFVALSDAKVNSTFARNALEHIYLLLRQYGARILYIVALFDVKVVSTFVGIALFAQRELEGKQYESAC